MDIHHTLLAKAAEHLGITVIDHTDTWRENALELVYGSQEEIIFEGRAFSSQSRVTKQLLDNKRATKYILARNGFPVADDLVVTKDDFSGIADFLEIHKTVIVKPLDWGGGKAVSMPLTQIEQIIDHIAAQQGRYERYLVEQFVEGGDVRVQSVGGKLVAACERLPAHVIGNGKDTVAALIERKNREKAKRNPHNVIVIDNEAQSLLVDQSSTIDSVPPAGKKIQLKSASNISTGGDAVDVTEELHPAYTEWIERMASIFETDIFAVDIMTTDYTADPMNHAIILEINSRAMWAHHTFSERRTHDIPTMILKSLFDIE